MSRRRKGYSYKLGFRWYRTVKGKRKLTRKAKEYLRKIKRKPKEIKLYRTTIACNFNLHNKYYSYRLTHYSEEPLSDEQIENLVDDFIEAFNDFFRDFTGYPLTETDFSEDSINIAKNEVIYTTLHYLKGRTDYKYEEYKTVPKKFIRWKRWFR
jgi:hypothetical protein